MDKEIYITEEERERCKRVAEVYAELCEKNEILVMDAGRYGYVKLQYYYPKRGFDEAITFTQSKELFENLWQEWLDIELDILAKGTPMEDMGYDEILQCMPKEKQKEFADRKADFARLAGVEE